MVGLNNNNNNKQICIVPRGRNVRGALLLSTNISYWPSTSCFSCFSWLADNEVVQSVSTSLSWVIYAAALLSIFLAFWSSFMLSIGPTRNVRRILVRGGQCPLAAWGEENLTTKWCILKYYVNRYVVSVAPFSAPACPDCCRNINIENCYFCMFSLFNFSSIFPGGGSADPICPYVRTPMGPTCFRSSASIPSAFDVEMQHFS